MLHALECALASERGVRLAYGDKTVEYFERFIGRRSLRSNQIAHLPEGNALDKRTDKALNQIFVVGENEAS